MKNLWSEILVPAVIAGLTVAGTAGVEVTRTVRPDASFSALRAVRLDTLSRDTLRKDTTARRDTLSLRDTLAVRDTLAGKDSLAEGNGDDEDFFDFFGGKPTEEDTLPKVTARDTMKVPDSLRTTDPFRYRWYVALKDSLTHRIVVDSLKEAGDTLEWPVIDSVYLADSAALAKEKFDRWYAGLSKAERKRYDYQQKLPAMRHRLDSIQHRKDSIQKAKDSILENTPRILETAFLPDSLYYKRLVAWKHDRYFNRVQPFDWDTTFNHHFHDYPYLQEDIGGTFLGMPGSAVQTYNFFKREDPEGTVSYYAPYESWTYSPSSLPMFNTKTPYTELSYYGNILRSETKSNDDIRIFSTQNILPSLNITWEYKNHGGAGILKNAKARNKTFYAAANHLGRKYLAHGGFIWNSVNRAENGGVVDNMWIRDTTVDVREVDVFLSSATNKYTKRSLFFDQTLRLPLSFIEDLRHKDDSEYVRKKDTLIKDITSVFIGTTSEYTVYNKYYVDAVNGSDANGKAFYHDRFYINPSKSADSLHTSVLDNRLFLRFQPWYENAVVSKIEGGIGDRLLSHNSFQPGDFLRKPSPERWNTVYVYAGAEGRLRRFLEWDALGRLNVIGKEAGGFYLGGNLKLSVFPFRRSRNSPITLSGRFETSLKEPEFYEQHLYTNHYMWDNDFSKISVTKVQAALDIPHWKLHAGVGYSLLANNIYYDTLGVVRQNTEPMSVLSATFRKDFHLGILRLENSALFQLSSRPDVVPLPKLAVNLRWYLQFPIVRPDVLMVQAGVDARYNTRWYTPGFNPVTGTFYNQNEEEYGNTPYFDVFLNLQWKKACIFIKMENTGQGWPMEKHDYFSAHHYIHTPRIIKFGIYWPFYPSLGNNRKMSDRAGSGMGSGGSRSEGGRSSR